MIQNREIDIDKYLNTLQLRLQEELNEIYIKQLIKYDEFLRHLVKGNRILSRKFYLIIEYDGAINENFQSVKTQLYTRRNIINRGLYRIGLTTRNLNGFEVLDLFRSIYNPEQTKLLPLRAQALLTNNLNKSHIVRAKKCTSEIL